MVSNIIKQSLACKEAIFNLDVGTDVHQIVLNNIDNCGIMSPTSIAQDVERANKKILLYIDSIKDKQRIVTPAQISKELGMSKLFIESMLIANGFNEE